MPEIKNNVVIIGPGKLLRLERKRDAVEILGIIALLLPTLAFLANGGLAGVTDAAGWFNAFNRLTALVGTSLLLIHMVLVARVPWLERTLGLDKLTHAHKRLGKNNASERTMPRRESTLNNQECRAANPDD